MKNITLAFFTSIDIESLLDCGITSSYPYIHLPLSHVVNTVNLVRRRKNLIDYYWRFNEDMFFSWFAYAESDKYRAANEEYARDFALEEDMKEEIEKGNIPYAVHAWEKHYPK